MRDRYVDGTNANCIGDSFGVIMQDDLGGAGSRRQNLELDHRSRFATIPYPFMLALAGEVCDRLQNSLLGAPSSGKRRFRIRTALTVGDLVRSEIPRDERRIETREF